MKITGIRQQQKRHDRYSIYVDNKYAFSLSENDLIKSGLRVNQELSREDLAKLQDESRLGKAYERAINYISIRERSEYEVTNYLKRKGYKSEIIAKVSQKLQKIGLIDDRKFARVWCEWRTRANKSKRQIHSELIKKHVNRNIIDEVLDSIDSDTELDQISAIIEQKLRLPRYQDKQKLIAFLARRGYSYGQIKEAIDKTNQ